MLAKQSQLGQPFKTLAGSPGQGDFFLPSVIPYRYSETRWRRLLFEAKQIRIRVCLELVLVTFYKNYLTSCYSMLISSGSSFK